MAVLEAQRQGSIAVSHGIEEPEPYTAEEFARLAADYPDLRMELTREGELIVMPATFPKSGRRNVKLSARLETWSEAVGLGETFDSSTLFTLPSGAIRSPDACWIEKSRWDALTEDEQDDLIVICPNFVAELRSKTDRLSAVQKKMREYMDNGARLGWLIDPISRRVEIYRPGQAVEILNAPASLSGEDVLPGFILDLTGILL